MQDKVTIAEAKDFDYEKLRDIFFTVRRDSFHWVDPLTLSLSDFDKSTKDELILAAFIENELAGFVSVWEPDRFIHNLFVRKEFQGRGIGTALVKEVSRRLGLPLTLKCVKANTDALNYYLSNQWTIEQEAESAEGLYCLMRYE
ncbi:GNAT family N-acetyltransferase [Paenibacillus hemerocallicola]|uniref:GNAT family N-acetyltransferase n=1 Tax=Paenibacillus hemerocallicola TaxID=1172614 RepID=A0A5C4SYC0_9BACL|nr:GNAT family N-acetyltransferase [Paenibacillus hemerocallicola]TNJ61598.1 GNAT family N-acetyltransferase [Paenibacillus hemerocallicola]